MGAPEAGWLIGARNRPEKSHAASQADKLDVGERKKDNGHVSRKHSRKAWRKPFRHRMQWRWRSRRRPTTAIDETGLTGPSDADCTALLQWALPRLELLARLPQGAASGMQAPEV